MKKTDALLLGCVSLAAISVTLFVFTPDPASSGLETKPPATSFPPAAKSASKEPASLAPSFPSNNSPQASAVSLATPLPTSSVLEQAPTGRAITPPALRSEVPRGIAGAAPAAAAFILRPGSTHPDPVTGRSTYAAELVAPNGQVFELEPDVRLPAALMALDPELPLTEEQEKWKSQISAEFLKRINFGQDLSVTWKAETERADRKFQMLFGREAYLRQVLNAEREARGVARW